MQSILYVKRDAATGNRLVLLIRRHRRLLTFVGAFIVFATFILKENFESELEVEVAQMRNARNIFFMRTQMSQISSEIFEVGNRLDGVSSDLDRDATPSSPGDGRAQRVQARRVNELRNRILALQSILSNIDVLRASSDEKQTEMAELRERLASIHQELEQSSPATNAADEAAARERTRRLSREVWAVDKSLHELAQASAKFSQETMERHRRQLELAKVASIALYVIGWGLGLLSKLVGENIDTDE